MRVRVPPPALATTVAAALVLAVLASRVGDWAVMTDELLYERLALGIVDGGVPRVRGELVDVFALLYPVLLAPVFLLFSLPGSVVAAHAWNGLLFASAAVPAVLLARRLAATPWLVAVLTVAIPWSVLTGFLMTENAAYPAFLWAILAIQHAAATPGDRAHALALGGVALATLARPQLVVLALVLALAVASEELRVRRGLRVHRVLVAAVALALLVVVALALTGSLGSAFGSYAPTVEEGSLLSRDTLRSALVHLDVVAVAIGIVPLLVGRGWALEAAVRAGVRDQPRLARCCVARAARARARRRRDVARGRRGGGRRRARRRATQGRAPRAVRARRDSGAVHGRDGVRVEAPPRLFRAERSSDRDVSGPRALLGRPRTRGRRRRGDRSVPGRAGMVRERRCLVGRRVLEQAGDARIPRRRPVHVDARGVSAAARGDRSRDGADRGRSRRARRAHDPRRPLRAARSGRRDRAGPPARPSRAAVTCGMAHDRVARGRLDPRQRHRDTARVRRRRDERHGDGPRAGRRRAGR